MILPDKHIKFAESLLGLGSYVLSALDVPKTLQELWDSYSKVNDSITFPAYHNFDHLVLSIDFLYSIGLIETTEDGYLTKCD
jgi:hypothetical protein